MEEKRQKDFRSATSASSYLVHAVRRRLEHKSSPLALRSLGDSSRPMADVNQTYCLEMKKPVMQLQPPQPLSPSLGDAQALIANRL